MQSITVSHSRCKDTTADELPKAQLWHIFDGPHLKCSHPVSVSRMFHGLPTEEREA